MIGSTASKEETTPPGAEGLNKDRVYVDLEQVKSAGLPIGRFPKTPDEADLAEDLIAKGLQELSLTNPCDHESIQFEVYGFEACRATETPELVERRLEELQKELDKLEAGTKQAFDLAQKINPGYANDRTLRLQFLRSRRLDAKEAALLMVKHFEVKRKLFGEGPVLGRDVRQSDLNDEDMMLVNSGFCQIMPERDAAGRLVFTTITSNFASKDLPTEGWSKESEVRLPGPCNFFGSRSERR